MKRSLGAVLLAFVLTATPALAQSAPKYVTEEKLKEAAEAATGAGDIAWMLVSTGLVLFMVPGLAMFYGGMVRRKNILGTMMQSMVAVGIVGVFWVLIGYALAFGKSQGGWIGWDPDLLCLNGVLEFKDGVWSHKLFPGTKLPIMLHCMYQGMFAIITPALISGAIAERIRFGPYCLFLLLWSTLVYVPLAHWVWAVDGEGNPAGWLGGQMKALDFAGGTVVHIAAGLSGLAAILVLRKRIGYPEHAMHPNSMVITLLGAGFLWVGWFGFNGGSALASNGLAASALTASQVAAAAAALSWMFAEWAHKGKPTALGFASGLVAGLVAVTPASGYVMPMGALIIGVLAGVVCYAMVCLKPVLKYDDSLDAFGVHGVGGFLGAVLTGVFASVALYKAGAGTASDDKPGELHLGKLILTETGTAHRVDQIFSQLLAAVVAVVLAFVVSLVLVKLIDLVWGFCLSPREETDGVDRTIHGEVGFDYGPSLEAAAEHGSTEPRAAAVPPNGVGRFTILVDGADDKKLIDVWSSLCQAGNKPPEPEFLAVYPYMTTVQGNRFHFRGGDPARLSDNLTRLFQKHLGGNVRSHLDNGGQGGNYGVERVPSGTL